MRTIVILAVTFALSATIYSQERKPTEPDQRTTLGNTITRQQVLSLPLRYMAPRLTLQRALKIAERFIKKEKINMTSCYLFEAKWIDGEDDVMEGVWRFWWVGINAASEDIKVAVSMDGNPKRLSPK